MEYFRKKRYRLSFLKVGVIVVITYYYVLHHLLVTYHINGISQDEWIKQVGEEIRKHTDRLIRVRNKPRPVMNGGDRY